MIDKGEVNKDYVNLFNNGKIKSDSNYIFIYFYINSIKLRKKY